MSQAARTAIAEQVRAGWAQGLSVDHSFAAAWDSGMMLASARTWWRIAADLDDQRPKKLSGKDKRVPRDKPVLLAMAPNHVWSWDITDLYSPWKSKSFKAYVIMDVFSRKIKGFRVEEREVTELAVLASAR